jgi:hypothetical protein
VNNPKILARIAGGLYLLLAVLGAWAHLFARSGIYVPGDATRTVDNIVANEALFRWAIVGDILMATLFVVLGMTLYRLLFDTSARLATLMMIFIAVGAGSILLNLTFHAGAWLVATEPAYASIGGDSAAVVLLLMDLHANGYMLGGTFFGLWLLPVGLLARRSPMFPKFAGVILIIGAIAWLFDPLLRFAAPNAPALLGDILSIPTSIAEFGLIIFLLTVGVIVRKPATTLPSPGTHSTPTLNAQQP